MKSLKTGLSCNTWESPIMWPYAYGKAFIEAHTWKKKNKKQTICFFTVATRIPSGKCWGVTPLLYVWTQHFGTLSRFSTENYPNKSPSPSLTIFFSAVFISPSEHSCPPLVYRPCCHGSLECSYVSIFAKHLFISLAHPATTVKLPIILPIYHFSEYELSNM